MSILSKKKTSTLWILLVQGGSYSYKVELTFTIDHYIEEHYCAIAEKSHAFKDEHISDRAKENLEIIGKVYDYE